MKIKTEHSEMQIQLCEHCRCEAVIWDNAAYSSADWMDDQDFKSMFKISDATLARMRKRKLIPYLKLMGKYLYPKILLYKCLSPKQ